MAGKQWKMKGDAQRTRFSSWSKNFMRRWPGILIIYHLSLDYTQYWEWDCGISYENEHYWKRIYIQPLVFKNCHPWSSEFVFLGGSSISSVGCVRTCFTQTTKCGLISYKIQGTAQIFSDWKWCFENSEEESELSVKSHVPNCLLTTGADSVPYSCLLNSFPKYSTHKLLLQQPQEKGLV